MEETIGIVILNYKNYIETISCVRSIRDKIEKIHPIIIVDNGSDNESFSYLSTYFETWKAVDVICTEKNLGFAKGNNFGIRYIRNRYHIDYILLLNSDTLIEDKNYIKKLLAKYKPGIGVIEANIWNRRGNFSQPSFYTPTIRTNTYMLIQSIFHYYYFYFPWRKCIENGKKYICQVGCAIMLTPEYFRHYKGLYSYTFLYGEEQILLILLDRVGLDIAFVDDTFIIHNEGGSTASSLLEGTRRKEKNGIRAYWNILLASCHTRKGLQKATE